MDDTNRQFELPPRKDLAAFLLLLDTGVTMGAAVVAVQSLQHGVSGLWNALFPSLVVLLAGLIAVSAAATLASKRPVLRVDDIGIVDNTTIMGPGLIKWDEIAAISYFHFMVSGYVLIEPRDVSTFARQKNIVQRATLWINHWISPAAIAIPDQTLEISPWELLRVIRTRFAPEIERYGIYVREEPKCGRGHKNNPTQQPLLA
jgi:hypothetical protein